MALSASQPKLSWLIKRSIHLTRVVSGEGLRERREGHIDKVDAVEGEKLNLTTTDKKPYELIDENIMDKLIGDVKFKDIPILHLKCTRNNTKMTLTDPKGQMIGMSTAGKEGFKNCRKGTTVAAQVVASRLLELTKDYEIDKVRMVFDGLGPGRNAAFKIIQTSNLNVISLSDRTEAIEPWIKRPRKARRV